MTHTLTTRRGVLSGAAATSALIASGSFKARAADTVVGFIYVGSRADFGWNQSHAVAAAALKQIPGMKVVEEENVPETAAVAKTMKSLITLDGASLIFGTSFGYFDPFMIDMAREFPKVQFRHPTSLWNKDKHPGEPGRLLLLHRASALRERSCGRSFDQVQQAGLYRRQADRAGAADDQCVRARRA